MATADVVPEPGSASVNTISGVPVVDIVAPTPAGVSHNTFQVFDVDTPGVVINNSLIDASATLPGVGVVSANPNFIGASASIILNEVTSTSRSSLQGVTEILGDDATYILANPNGITCNGCGFIRTPTQPGDNGNLREVILSTADTLNFNGGALDSLGVAVNSPADIIIGPGGLDVSGVDVTTLFTRRLNIAGLVNAGDRQLQLLSGTGTLLFDAAVPADRSYLPSQSDDGAVTVAIDASVAGAMNAGRIYILATEDGVGVSLDTTLAASAGDVVLTANGDIVYRNISATGNVDVSVNATSTATAALTVNGDTTAGNDINWSLAGDAALQSASSAASTLTAGNAVNIACATAGCEVQAQNDLDISAASLNSDAVISTTAGGNLALDASTIVATDVASGNDLGITATGAAIFSELASQGTITVTADSLNAGNVTAAGAVDITTTTDVVTADLNSQSLQLNSGSISTGNIDTGGNTVLQATIGDMVLGSVTSGGEIRLLTQRDGALLSSNGLNSTSGVQWQLTGNAMLAGNISAADTLTLTCNTPSCSVTASNELQLSAQQLVTDAAIRTTGGADLRIDAALQAGAELRSDGNLTLAAASGDITSTAAVIAAQTLRLVSADNGLVRLDGGITTGGDFVVTGQGSYIHSNNAAQNISGQWIIDTNRLTNNSEIIATELQNGVFRVDEFVNNGLLHSDGALTVQVDSLLQNNGTIRSLEGTVTVGSSGGGKTAVIDNNGMIQALNLSQSQQPENTLIINPQSFIDEHVAAILAGEQRTAQSLAQAIDRANQQALSQLSAGSNVQGVLQIDAGVLNNAAGGQLLATQIVLNADTLDNQGGVIAAGENLAIDGVRVDNRNSAQAFGVITARDNIDILLSEAFNNTGVLEAADVIIDAPLQNNAATGLVLSSLSGQTLETADIIEQLAAQPGFAAAPNTTAYYQSIVAQDNNPLVQSGPARLTESFLREAGVDTASLPLAGDDIFLAQAISAAIRRNGDIPFVSGSRNSLMQLAALYDNTLAFMVQTGLPFAQMPSSEQRLQMTAPVLVFQPHTLSNGDSVLAATVLLSGDGQQATQLAAEQLNSRILAYNDLLLKGDRITTSGDLIAGNTLQVEAIDLNITTTQRNWYVDEQGEVQYHGAVLSAPTMAINLTGSYVQQGGLLISDSPVVVQADSIDIDAASVTVQAAGAQTGAEQTAQAVIESEDTLLLLAQQRLSVGSGARIISTADATLSADELLRVDGQVEAVQGLTLSADRIEAGIDDTAELRSARSVVLQAGSAIELGEADITVAGVQAASNEQSAQGIALLAELGGISTGNSVLSSVYGATLSALDSIVISDSDIDAADLFVISEQGDIINDASDLRAQNSGFMQAGGSIINRSRMTLTDNTSTRSTTESSVERRYDDDPDAGILDYDIVTTQTRTLTINQSQQVDTAVAAIRTGEGELIQIAGGDILNQGGEIATQGDLYQQAEGSIRNQMITQDYLKSRITTVSTTTKQTDNAFGRSMGSDQTVNTRILQTNGVVVQQGTISSGGSLSQVAGADIENLGSSLRADGLLYLQAKGNISNTSVDKTVTSVPGRADNDTHSLYSANITSGQGYVAEAKGGTFSNTGNIDAGNGVNITARDIINTRMTRSAGSLRQYESTKSGRGFYETTETTATVTTGGLQILDSGSISAGDNIVLNASNQIIDTAGRYRAGRNSEMYDADGKVVLDADGKAVRGGIYASADNGIEMKAIQWTENDTVDRIVSRQRYDDNDEDYRQTTSVTRLGTSSRDYSVTGSLEATGYISLDSGEGDLALDATRLDSGRRVMLTGRNIDLNAVKNVTENLRSYGRTIDNDKTVTHNVVQLNAQNGIDITTTGDKKENHGNLTSQGAVFNAGTAGNANVVLNITGNTDLGAVNNETGSYYQHTRKRSFGRRKTTIRETRDVTLKATEINAGGHLLVNVEMDENGELVGMDSGSVTLTGTKLNTGGNAVIYGEDGVSILSGLQYSYERNETRKKSFGGLRRSGSSNVVDEAYLGHAELNTGGNTVLLSQGDINVVAGKIDADNITADAGFGMSEAERVAAKADGRASVNIIGEDSVLRTLKHKYDKSISLSLEDNFLSFSEELVNRDWSTEIIYSGSGLKADNSIILRAASDINIKGSSLGASNNIALDAGNDVNIVSASNQLDEKNEFVRQRTGIEVKSTGNSYDAFAGKEKNTTVAVLDSESVAASSLQAGSNISIRAGNDITQVGSDVAAGNNINYNAAGSIVLDVVNKTETASRSETIRRDGITSSLTYNYDNTREAVRNAGEGDNLVTRAASTLQAVDSLSSFASGPTATISAGTSVQRNRESSTSSQARGSTATAGGVVSMSAGEQIHIAGSAVVADLDINMDAQDISIVAVESVTDRKNSSRFDNDGFELTGQGNSASVGITTSFDNQRSNLKTSSAVSSLLSAGRNASIKAENDIRINGSDMATGNDITLDAGRDVLLEAHESGYNMVIDNNSGSAGVGIAVSGQGGGAVGIYVSGRVASNDLDRQGKSFRNAQVSAGNQLTIKSGRDTKLQGANATGGNVDLDVGGDFIIASVQDTGTVDGESKDISLRVVAGAGAAVSGSVGAGSTKGSKAWVSQQSSLIARDRMDIKVQGHTQIDGAVVASETDNMQLETTTLGFSDILDHEKETSRYLNVGFSASNEQAPANPIQQQNNRQTGLPTGAGQATQGGSAGGTLSASYSNIDRAQINRATLGAGTVIVHSDQQNNTNSLAGINRDLEKSREITRDDNSTTQIYLSDSSLASVSDPAGTAKQWLSGIDNYGVNILQTYETMNALPEQDADGLFGQMLQGVAKSMMDITNTIGSISGGMVPSVANHGGVASQAPALAVGDMQYRRVKALLDYDQEHQQVILVDQDSQPLDKNRIRQGETVFTNGILNSQDEAIQTGAMHTNQEEFVLAYNPTHGFIGDLIEAAWDKALGSWLPSGNVRDLQGFYEYNIDADISFNIAAHSQGGLLSLYAIDGLDFSNGGSINTGTVLFSGVPVDAQEFYKTTGLAGFVVDGDDKGAFFQVNRADGESSLLGQSLVDPVSDLLGGNYNEGDNSDFWGSVFSLLYVNSVHGGYLCQGNMCNKGTAAANTRVLDEFRNSVGYIESTVLEPNQETLQFIENAR